MATPLKLVVDTTKPGSANDTFILPLDSGSTYDFTVDWGEGAPEVVTNATGGFPNISHTYSGPGVYTLEITENTPIGFPTIRFGYGGDCQKLMEISQWGDSVTWQTMQSSFAGCQNLVITATDESTAVTGGITSFHTAFRDCTSLISFPLIDTSAGIVFENAWVGCSGLLSFPLINTALGTNFIAAWLNCSGLTSFPNLDLSSADLCINTWQGCSGLTTFPLLNLSSVTDVGYAWDGCTALTSFPAVDTSSVTVFVSAWQNCPSMTSFPVLDMRAMLYGSGCFQYTTIPTSTYSSLLIDLAANNPNNTVTFHGGNAQYDAGASSARSTLTTTKSWTITDGGAAPPAPTIEAHPMDIAILEGSTGTFGVSASNADYYKWYSYIGGVTGTFGETGPQLYLDSALRTAQGEYSAVALNGVGSAESDPATLTVNWGPEIIAQPTGANVLMGQPFTLTSGATGQPGVTGLYWLRDGNPAGTGDVYSVLSATGIDGGTYQFVASNGVGPDALSDEVVVSVLMPPTIVVQPVDTTVYVGATGVFTVGVTGSDSISWYSMVGGVTGTFGVTGTILYVLNAQELGQGTYRALALNEAGTTESDAASLAVVTTPSIMDQPLSIFRSLGTTGSFEVTAVGDPDYSVLYQWNHDGSPVSGATGSAYYITTALGTVGEYQVHITNGPSELDSDVATLTTSDVKDVSASINACEFKILFQVAYQGVDKTKIVIPYIGYGNPTVSSAELTIKDYSMDNGVTWLPMTTSSGLTGLAFTPTGTAHTLVWDARTDQGMGVYNTAIRVRFGAVDGAFPTRVATATLFFERVLIDLAAQKSQIPFPDDYAGTPPGDLLVNAPKVTQ